MQQELRATAQAPNRQYPQGPDWIQDPGGVN